MLAKIITGSIRNRFMVCFVTLLLCIWGIWCLFKIRLDAVPDLSDVQVIVYTQYVGQPPQVVEDQVTYPLVTNLLGVPHVKVVRGFSYFNFSQVYVVFEDGVDLYWARSRVLEYLNYAAAQLPREVTPVLGPDSTGAGWIFEYALEDPTGQYDLAQLRSYQDWHLKFQLATVPGVAEVASLGGFIKQYQVEVDPRKLVAYKIPISRVERALKAGNNDVGGRTIERAGQEYRITALGYITGLDDIRSIPLAVGPNGAPIYLGDVAEVHIGPELRRGVSDLDGKGDAVVGIVEMREGENALNVIRDVKQRLDQLRKDLPPELEIVPIYDRSGLIDRALKNLRSELLEESIIVVLVTALFLLNLGAATVAVLIIPAGLLLAAIVMFYAGFSADIMSMSGVAVALGAMVDAAVVMVDNAHRYIAAGTMPRERAIVVAATEVGPALFFSLLVITASFVPVFALQAQAGRLFKPLAFTKTTCMAAAALLSITLIPALMTYLMRHGKQEEAEGNALDRLLGALYRRPLNWVLQHRGATALFSLLLLLSTVIPWSRIGLEFLPPIFEGDLIYAPTAYPGISITQSKLLLQRADRIIMTFPEVEHVLGKMGRAETATDSVNLYMGEILIKLRPRSQWPGAISYEQLIERMDRALRFPGIINSFSMPIKERTDNVNTGVKTTLGLKIYGTNLADMETLGRRIEQHLRALKGTRNVLSDRVYQANYINFYILRTQAARYGLSVDEVENAIQLALGGKDVTMTVEGPERYPVNVRYPRELRDTPRALGRVILYTSAGAQVPLAQVARIESVNGATAIKTEAGRLTDWIYIDLKPGYDIGSYVKQARRALADIKLPRGSSMAWSGEYIYLHDAIRTLLLITPLALLISFFILYLNFGTIAESLLVMGCLPFAAIGGIWALYLLGYNLSIAAWMGMLVLVGFAVEGGVVMLVYMVAEVKKTELVKEAPLDEVEVDDCVARGALRSLRPKLMVVILLIFGLLPIFAGHASGGELMRRIAAPVVGGMVTVAPTIFLSLPVAYSWWRRRIARKACPLPAHTDPRL